MDLSIIIVNYNTLEITRDCIESVLKTTSRIDLEIILVDNGSTDGSKVYFTELAKKIEKVKYIYNTSNLGFSRANNIGLKNSIGDFTLLLNSDTLVKKGSIKKLLDFAKSRDEVGVVGARLLNEDGSTQKSCFYFPTLKRAIGQYWQNKHKELDKFAPSSNKPIVVDAVVGAAMLITPESRKSVGLLDERYFMFFEDVDYCRRVSKKGLKTFYIPKSEIIHLHGKSGENLAKSSSQWKRLIPSSKIYHGIIKHHVFNFILWSGQKMTKFRKKYK
ncbi:glycosyltransferase family 2 protein [Patescibacteria group bacterium]